MILTDTDWSKDDDLRILRLAATTLHRLEALIEAGEQSRESAQGDGEREGIVSEACLGELAQFELTLTGLVEGLAARAVHTRLAPF